MQHIYSHQQLFIDRIWLVLIIVALIQPANSAVYRWTDEKGGVHFSDQKVHGATIVDVEPVIRWYDVASVYDGDTVTLDDGRKIRLLGINTPEISNYQRDGEPAGIEARDKLKALIGNQQVRIEWDKQRQDKYKRWLAHLFDKDGNHLNETLVRAGLAVASIIPPNITYVDELLVSQQLAEQEQLGIWSMPYYQARSLEEALANPRRGWQRVIAVPTKISRGRSFIRLDVNDSFSIHIPNGSEVFFPPLENYLYQKLELRGWISKHKGHYSFYIRHPSALSIVE